MASLLASVSTSAPFEDQSQPDERTVFRIPQALVPGSPVSEVTPATASELSGDPIPVQDIPAEAGAVVKGSDPNRIRRAPGGYAKKKN